MTEPGRNLSQECKICNDYDAHYKFLRSTYRGPVPLSKGSPTPSQESTSSSSSKKSSSSKRSASSSTSKESSKSRKIEKVTVDAILETRLIQLLNASRNIVEEHHTVPCIDGVVVPQLGKPNYNNPEEMVQHMEQALKHQQQQIARDKRTIDHVNIAMRKILEKPNLEPEQKLNKALELLERISNDRFMLKQLNVHKLTMERIVTSLRNSIIDTMTSNTKQMMDQARQEQTEKLW